MIPVVALDRETILQAMTEVIRCRGYGGATMRAIARKAGVSVGYLYNWREFFLVWPGVCGIFFRANEGEKRKSFWSFCREESGGRKNEVLFRCPPGNEP
ncbi:MAG: Bacterial regulatory protein tetR family [Eubacteriales bacterium]|nr:Bacterial regulatory protein tetR family [Eubacteriales bacterium]MDN5363501.1 Bacterial regulatory protein tetR family [Eubacteriales bacterium]